MRCTILSCLVLTPLLASSSLAQVIIHEKLEIHPKAPQQRRKAASNTQKVDSTSAIERLTAGFALTQTSTSSSTSSAGPQIVLPNGGTVTARIVGGASNAVLDLVLRSPESLTLFTNANSHHGESWMSPQYEAGATVKFGLHWTYRGGSGSEIGALLFRMNDSTYYMAFEDVGISPMFQDLLVVVVVHGASVASTNTVTLQLYSNGDVTYGDENFLSVDGVTDGGDSYTFPAGTVFTFAVTSGAEWGILYDYDRGREGTVLNDIPWQEPFGPDVSFRAWGNSPATQQQVTVTMSTMDPNVLPGSADFSVLPSTIDVSVAPTVQQGQSAQLTVRKKLDGGGTEPLPANTFVAFYIALGSQAGSLISNDSSQTGDYVSGNSATAIFHARIDPLLPDAVPVIMQVYTDFGSGLGKLVVLKEDLLDHFVVVVERDTVAQGDAVKVFVIPKYQNGNTVTIQDETPLDFSLDDAGASLGNLETSNGKLTMIAYASVKVGTTILTFVANEAPPPALATAARNTKTSSVSVQLTGTAQATEEPPTIIGVATINVTKTTDPSKKGSGIVTVKKPRFPTKIELTVSSDQVQHSETIVLKVTLKDKDGKAIPADDGLWGVNFFLGAEGVQYGSLKNSAGGVDAVTLNGVPYKQASDGSIAFVADGAAYDGRFPLGISVGVSVVVDGSVYSDVKGIYLRGPLTTGVLFTQSDPTWADLIYDSQQATIGDLGCAMTVLAMILKAGGLDANPISLNSLMIDQKLFTSRGGVNWTAVDSIPGSSYSYSNYRGRGIDKNLGEQSSTVPLSEIDPFLSNGDVIVGQVFNSRSGNPHWVLVTGKYGTEYAILDPAGYIQARTNLKAYNNQVYKFVIFSKN